MTPNVTWDTRSGGNVAVRGAQKGRRAFETMRKQRRTKEQIEAQEAVNEALHPYMQTLHPSVSLYEV